LGGVAQVFKHMIDRLGQPLVTAEATLNRVHADMGTCPPPTPSPSLQPRTGTPFTLPHTHHCSCARLRSWSDESSVWWWRRPPATEQGQLIYQTLSQAEQVHQSLLLLEQVLLQRFVPSPTFLYRTTRTTRTHTHDTHDTHDTHAHGCARVA
jgi:hypothetical protein